MLPRTWGPRDLAGRAPGGFVTLQEQSRVIGRDQLKRMFFGQKGKPPSEIRLRDVA